MNFTLLLTLPGQATLQLFVSFPNAHAVLPVMTASVEQWWKRPWVSQCLKLNLQTTKAFPLQQKTEAMWQQDKSGGVVNPGHPTGTMLQPPDNRLAVALLHVLQSKPNVSISTSFLPHSNDQNQLAEFLNTSQGILLMTWSHFLKGKEKNSKRIFYVD